jgi:putative endonuclease
VASPRRPYAGAPDLAPTRPRTVDVSTISGGTNAEGPRTRPAHAHPKNRFHSGSGISGSCRAYNWRVHFVYIVRCADGTLYTGYARDPRARERAHNSGRGAKYTAGRRPVRLVYQEAFRSIGKALAREYVVKHLTRAQKDALVISARRRHR